jgi:phosphatidylinositol-bisphosphatase
VPYPNPTILTFVNTHLAAFDEMAEKRNSDFHELSRRLLFGNAATPSTQDTAENDDLTDINPPATPLSIGEAYEAEMTESEVNASLCIYETDTLFWMVSLFFFLKRSLNLFSTLN